MICGIVRLTLIKRLSSTTDLLCKALSPFSILIIKDLTLMLNRGHTSFGNLVVCRTLCCRYRGLYPTLSCTGRTNALQDERRSRSKQEHACYTKSSFSTWLSTQTFLKYPRCFVSNPGYPRSVDGFERLQGYPKEISVYEIMGERDRSSHQPGKRQR